jgi:hypothetical protein
MWVFEPSVAERILRAMAEEAGVPVREGRRLEAVLKTGAAIASIRVETGEVYAGRMFVDATYEGDLMARAGVSYHVGREANAVYGETLNGVQTRHATSHQFKARVDPYVVPGDARSGLLAGVHGGGPGEEGAGDRRVQAYNFRLTLTDAPANRLPIPRPEDGPLVLPAERPAAARRRAGEGRAMGPVPGRVHRQRPLAAPALSIRMEPVFMILAQSAATAASLALDGNGVVQDVPYARLRERLLADGQVLEWDASPARR